MDEKASPSRPGLFLRLLSLLDPRGIARLPGLAIELLRIIVLAIREFLRDSGFQWASALAFTTILALVPLGILGFALIGIFETAFDMDLEGSVQEFLTEQGLPDAAGRAAEEIQTLVERSSQSSTGLGLVGMGFLFVTALGLYGALERAFNHMWKIRHRRGALRRFRSFWLVITLGPVLVGVSVYATAALRALGASDRTGVLGTVVDGVFFLLPFVVTWATFFLFYVYLPNTRVGLKSALLGAILAGSAWEVAKWGFNAYVSNAGNIDRVYGALGILPVFILWIYLTWIVGLLGGEVSYVHQHRRAVLADAAGKGAEQGATRELAALGILLEVYRPFREGGPPPDLRQMADRMVVRGETAREILVDLEQAQLVRVDSDGYYLPAREASRITLAEGVAAVRGLAGAVADLWETPVGQRMIESFDAGEERRTGALAQVTLEDVLAAEAAVGDEG